jgi:hypothetical protein
MEDGKSFKEVRVRVSVRVSVRVRERFWVTSGVAERVGGSRDFAACFAAEFARYVACFVRAFAMYSSTQTVRSGSSSSP